MTITTMKKIKDKKRKTFEKNYNLNHTSDELKNNFNKYKNVLCSFYLGNKTPQKKPNNFGIKFKAGFNTPEEVNLYSRKLKDKYHSFSFPIGEWMYFNSDVNKNDSEIEKIEGALKCNGGTGLVNGIRQDEISSSIGGSTPDRKKIWGNLIGPNGQNHAFTINVDGTGFLDLTPQGVEGSIINNITPDGTKAWGTLWGQGNQTHCFITKIDGTGFVDLTPQGASYSYITDLAPDAEIAWGQFADINGRIHSFINKTDGNAFVDLSPLGSIQSSISGLTPDNTKAWGQFYDKNNQSHAFITKTDGTGFTDLTPPNAISSTANGITSDGKIYGTYQTVDQKWHGFIVPT